MPNKLMYKDKYIGGTGAMTGGAVTVNANDVIYKDTTVESALDGLNANLIPSDKVNINFTNTDNYKPNGTDTFYYRVGKLVIVNLGVNAVNASNGTTVIVASGLPIPLYQTYGYALGGHTAYLPIRASITTNGTLGLISGTTHASHIYRGQLIYITNE